MQKNELQLAGYLAAKPMLRVLPSGTKVANARMAEGYRYIEKQTKTPREHTNWHNLVFYGVLADIAATYDKGDNVCVEGSLQTRQFIPKDGSQRTIHEVIVKTCHLIEAPRTKHEAPAANEPGVEHDLTADQQASAVASNQHEWPA
jgi:single-strand DNA-binding protein